MIAEIKKKMVAFRCSDCGTVIKSINNIFSIPGEKKVLKCDCGNHMDIVTTSDGKLRFSLRCRFCGNIHNFNINRSTIFNAERIILPCDVTSQDILFIGDPGRVYQAIEASEKVLDEWAEASGYDDFGENNNCAYLIMTVCGLPAINKHSFFIKQFYVEAVFSVH